jgi:aryl-alcohol dehydrogenase-like predicted oxidoreductase
VDCYALARRAGIPTGARNICSTPWTAASSAQLDCVDLRCTPYSRVPFAYSVGALAQAQRAGKIRHIGLSNISVKQLEQARRIAPIVSVQNRYNVEDRASDDVLAACERLDIAFLPWFPLGAGGALRSAGVANRDASQRRSRAGAAGLAAREIARDAADSRHRFARTSRGKHRRREVAAFR